MNNWDGTCSSFKTATSILIGPFQFDWQDATSDEAGLLANEQRREQMMVEQEQIDVDLALLQEREQRIHQLEVSVVLMILLYIEGQGIPHIVYGSG